MNYGIWMTNAEKIRGGFESASGNAFYATSPLSYSDGKWHYVVVTFDGSAIGLYIDGFLLLLESASASPDSGGDEPIRMGIIQPVFRITLLGMLMKLESGKLLYPPNK